MIALLDEHREGRLAGELKSLVHLVHYEPGRVEFRPEPGADKSLANRLGAALMELTNVRWAITLSSDAGEATLAEQAMSAAKARRIEAAEHPLVKAALEIFPGAKIVEVREAANLADDAPLQDPDADMDLDSHEENE
jgi:DNA polymerase-3 subunit gamma/tau